MPEYEIHPAAMLDHDSGNTYYAELSPQQQQLFLRRLYESESDRMSRGSRGDYPDYVGLCLLGVLVGFSFAIVASKAHHFYLLHPLLAILCPVFLLLSILLRTVSILVMRRAQLALYLYWLDLNRMTE